MSKPIATLLFLFSWFMFANVESKTVESNNQFQFSTNKFQNAIDNKVNFVFGIDKFDLNRFDIIFYESIADTETTNYSSSPKYNLSYAGIQRGLKLASLDIDLFRTDPLSGITYKIDSLEFTYKFLHKIKIDEKSDNSFFTYVLNKKQIHSLKIKHNYNKLNKLQSNTDWINPNQEYYKFYSIRDGIARISQSKLIERNSSWLGKQVSNFQIYNRGKQLKFYSTTNAIQHDGYIYLVVTHASGDTSYFDFYNGKEPYFITYNPNETSETYKQIDNNISGNELQNVEINNHYEKDNIYGNGYDVTETEQVLCENWYIGELRVQNDFNRAWEFYTNFSLFPTSDLNIEYNYASNIYFLPETIYNKTLLKVNNQKYDTISTVGTQVVDRIVKVNKNELLNGSNYLNLNSYKVIADGEKNKYNGIIGLDFFNITGNILPIAENSYLSFISDNQTDSYVNVKGFESAMVVSIDTVNNTIQFPQTSSSNIISIGSKGKYTSVYYNKLAYSSYYYGYHIVTNFGNSNTSQYFKEVNDFINYVNSLSNTNNTVIVINTENNINSQVKDIIQQKFGSSLVGSATNKFLFAKLNNKIYESITGDIFNTDVEGNYYSAIINLPKGEKSRKIICSTPYLQDIELQESKLKIVEEGNYDAFYIYHPIFEPIIDDYINYISSKEDKKILKLDVEQLYDTYGYGVESPHSIKTFLQIAYDTWEHFPEFLTLVGDATWDPKKNKPDSFVDQRIPAYGIPYTDNFYGTLEGNDLLPEAVIGRIPSNTEQDLRNYLDKVKSFYEVPLNPWMKNVLQISGGDDDQKAGFTEIMQGLNTLFSKSYIHFDTTLVSKTSSSTVSEENADKIKEEINEGKIWINFLGHGSPSIIDMNGWEAPNLHNKGRYGILNTMSCNTSAFAEPWQYNSIGEDFVNIKDKGTIATIGGTSSTHVGIALSVSTAMFFTLLDEKRPERNIGRIYNSYKARNAGSPTALNQVVLLGDPLISLRIPVKPDLLIFKKDIDITNAKNNSIIIEGDTLVKVKYIAYNLGIINNDSINIQIIHTFKNTSDTLYQKIATLGFHKDLEFEFSLKNSVGEHRLSINIDYDSTSNDVDYTNNLADTTFNVFSLGITPIEPLDNWNVSSENTIFRFVNPTKTPKTYNFNILDEQGNSVFSSTTPDIYENYIELKANNLEPDKRYILEYYTTELNSGTVSDIKVINFHTESQIDSVVHYQSTNTDQNLSYTNLKLDNNNLVFADKEYGVLLSSARGNAETGAERHSLINTYDKSNNNKEFRYINRLRRGFDLVIIPDIIEDTNVVNIQFDTWSSLNPDYDIFEDSRRLDQYLHDSLPYGYYLLLATADVPMRAPEIIENDKGPDSLGSSSRIIQALKDLGAKNVDSLSFNSSYILFTRIGFPESTIDRHLFGDTIQLKADFTRYQTNAHISISKIRNIKNLISGKLDINRENVNLNSSLVSTLGNTVYQSTDINFALDSLIIGQNSNLSYNLDIIRDSVGAPFSFGKLYLNFIPAPELAIVESQTKFEKDDYERGYVANYNYKVENLSTRSNSEKPVLSFTLDNNINPFVIADTIDIIEKDNSISSIKTIQTKDLALKNTFTLSVDPKAQQNELYTFNNIYKTDFNIREDTTKPWLIAYADNHELKNNDVVTERPKFTIELYDKSPLEVMQDEAIFVRINRRVILSSTSDSFNLQFINDGELKAKLTFVPNFDLDIGDNSLQVIGKDATGNHADTIDYHIFLPNKNEIVDLINYPNPFNDITTFRYKYIGKDNKAHIQITIFDAIGNKVSTIFDDAIFGENEIVWQGRNDIGQSVSSGAYYYRIDMLDKYADPQFGQMIKVR